MLASLGQGDILLGNAGYDSDALRQELAARGARVSVKPMPNRRNVPAFSSFLYRYRNMLERFFNKRKHFKRSPYMLRHIAGKLPHGHQLASARIWMRYKVYDLVFKGNVRNGRH
jgi:transposase